MKFFSNKWSAIAALAAAVALLAAFAFSGSKDPQYFTDKVQRGDIHDLVEATGTINAVTTVQVGSQVSGTIQKLYADFNSHVKAGQVIAQIEPSLFAGAVLQAKADLENAKANLAAAKANLARAEATAQQASTDYARNQGLARDGVISAQQLDQAKAGAQTSVADVSSAQAQVTQAAADVQQKAATLDIAQTNLDHATIRSPIDGTVVARNVDVGQTVAASLQAPTLFTIAQDLTRMQIYVSTDESDVGSVQPGQIVSFKVDAFPTETFNGRVSQVRLDATTVQNVVTYTTVVDVANPGLKLFPGMTAYVTIPVANAANVIKVPNGALRFTPDLQPGQLAALYARYGIDAQPGSKTAKGAAAAAPRETQSDVSVLWKLGSKNALQPVEIRTDITDHTFTEAAQVLHGSLDPGDDLVTGETQVRQAASPAAPGAAGMNRGTGR